MPDVEVRDHHSTWRYGLFRHDSIYDGYLPFYRLLHDRDLRCGWLHGRREPSSAAETGAATATASQRTPTVDRTGWTSSTIWFEQWHSLNGRQRRRPTTPCRPLSTNYADCWHVSPPSSSPTWSRAVTRHLPKDRRRRKTPRRTKLNSFIANKIVGRGFHATNSFFQ